MRALVLLFLVAGCGSYDPSSKVADALGENGVRIFQDPDVVEIYRIGDGDGSVADRSSPPVTLTSSDAEAVRDALGASIDGATQAALCFNPHHGIRARRGDASIDVVICLGCSQIRVDETTGAAIDPAPLERVLGPIFELRLHQRFVVGPNDSFGHWEPIPAT